MVHYLVVAVYMLAWGFGAAVSFFLRALGEAVPIGWESDSAIYMMLQFVLTIGVATLVSRALKKERMLTLVCLFVVLPFISFAQSELMIAVFVWMNGLKPGGGI